MKIQILGTGCAKCNQLAAAAKAAADRLGLDYEMEKVTDFLRFADFGVMITPALVVDGKLKVGKLNVDENPGTTSRFGIRGIPTLILFKDGKAVDQVVGLVSQSELKTMVQGHL